MSIYAHREGGGERERGGCTPEHGSIHVCALDTTDTGVDVIGAWQIQVRAAIYLEKRVCFKDPRCRPDPGRVVPTCSTDV